MGRLVFENKNWYLLIDQVMECVEEGWHLALTLTLKFYHSCVQHCM
jgi:hypothetical protein